MSKHPYYVKKMNSEFKLRNSKNSLYSLRSFARDLNIDSSSLSSIMNGKRKIPKGKIDAFSKELCRTEDEMMLFLESANTDHISLNMIRRNDSSDVRHLITEEEFATVSDIHTYTLLSLIETHGFKNDSEWISRKLKKEIPFIKDTISKLLNVGLIEEKGGTLVRVKKRTTTTDGISSKYIMKHHLDSLEFAKSKCQELPLEERYFSTLTIPSDPNAIAHVKKLCVEFENKLEAYLESLEKKEVFKFSLQFYQATDKIQ